MRFIGAALPLLALLMASGPTGRADTERFQWPLRPTQSAPTVTRIFDAPAPDWQRGHRGVDLAGTPGQPVYAAGSGTVVYAGMLAGRPVISVQHESGLRTSYEPVEPAVPVGRRVTAGTGIGRLVAGHRDCPVAACLHWGAQWKSGRSGPAQGAQYVDPLGLLAATPVRLKPVN